MKVSRTAPILMAVLGIVTVLEPGEQVPQGIPNVLNAAHYASLQEALDSVPPTGGTVVIPAGDYAIDGPLILRSSRTRLLGDGCTTRIRLVSGSAATAMIRVRRRAGVRIESLALDGNGENQHAQTDGIVLENAPRTTVSSVCLGNMHNFAIAVENGSDGCRIEGTKLERATRGISVRRSRECVIKGNLIERGNEGIALLPGADGTWVEENHIRDAVWTGIYVDGSSNNLISHNVVTGTQQGDGIALGPTTGSSFNRLVDNEVSFSAKSGIALDNGSDGNLLLGNLLRDQRAYSGVWVGAGSRNDITSNVLLRNPENGVRIYGPSAVANRIVRNVFEGNRKGAVYDSGIATVIYGNILRGK
jgi:parallel beta-helix repeat protein